MKLNRHLVTVSAALLLSMYAPRMFAQVRIAVVDLQRALTETEDGRRAKARLKRLFKQRQEELDRRQGELKAKKEEIDSNAKVWSKEITQKRLEDWQKAFVELQSTYVEYQRELAEKETEMTQQILERMERIIRRIGQAEGYTLILERSGGGVAWAPANLDVTDVVIQRYNSGEGRDGEGGAAAPAGGPAKTKAPAKKAG